MGYLGIANLYKSQEILLFKRAYAMEKIDGSSAHVSWNKGKLGFFSGGAKHESFVALFDQDALAKAFETNFGTDMKVVVYGEVYGGKLQGMSKTYGPNLKFIVFDVLTNIGRDDTLPICHAPQNKQSATPSDPTIQEACAKPATKNANGNDESNAIPAGQTETENDQESDTSNMRSDSLQTSSIPCLESNRGSVPSAENLKLGETEKESWQLSASITTTQREKFEDCSAIAVTSPSEPQKMMSAGSMPPDRIFRYDCWLAVPKAENVAHKLGLEFVHYTEIQTDLAAIDAERDADSVQAVRNGMGLGHMREGVVLRPLIEVTLNNGERIIVKHKRDEFRERQHVPKVVDAAKMAIMTDAQAIADEWVIPMRLEHILQEHPNANGIEHTGEIVKAMIQDVRKESKGEIAEGREIDAAIGRAASKLWKRHISTNTNK